MHRPLTLLCLLGVLCLAAGGSWAGPDPASGRIYFHGRIFTAEPAHPYAEAVATRGGRIVAVGNEKEVRSAAGKDAEEIDLKGKTLLPGLIDSHIHAMDGGLSFRAADAASKTMSANELAEFALEEMKKGHGMHGEILVVSGLPSGAWTMLGDLNARFNSGEFTNRPLFLDGADEHAGWANQALRRRAGLTKEFIRGLPEAQRKYYGYGPDFEPNGFAADAGLKKIYAALPEPALGELVEGGRASVRYLNSLGITSWLDPHANNRLDEHADRLFLEAYRELARRGELTAHVAVFPKARFDGTADPLRDVRELRKEFANVPQLTIPGVKVFADGVVEFPTQTAALSAPYRNSGGNGDLLFSPDRFAKMMIAADHEGLIVHIHAIGDQAVTQALNGIEAARKANGSSGPPHTITHLEFVKSADFPRFKELGVVASFQLLWASAEPAAIDLVQPYIAPEIFAFQYPARSLLDAGATIAGGSDWTVSTPNVFEAIYQAETRKGPEGVLNEKERMPREAMLYAYTRNAALAMGQLENVGSIAPGKQADFVVVDRDVLTVPVEELKETKVLMTIVGGKTVYQSRP